MNEKLGISDERNKELEKTVRNILEMTIAKENFGKAEIVKEVINDKGLTDAEKGMLLFGLGGTLTKIGML